MKNDQIKRVLSALVQAKSPAPLGYLSLHAGIKEPLEILRKMETMGLVCQSPSCSWSCCIDPMFEIVLPAKEEPANTVIAQMRSSDEFDGNKIL